MNSRSSSENAPVYDAATVARLLRIEYTPKKLAIFGPPPEPREGFLTFFDPGWSILRLRDFAENKKAAYGYFEEQSWYDAEDFAKKEEPPCYRQVRLEGMTNSFSKKYWEQLSLLTSEEEVPHARVVVMGMVLHFLATDKNLFWSYFVRCQGSKTQLVIVGNFPLQGLVMDDRLGGFSASKVGLASSRKF